MYTLLIHRVLGKFYLKRLSPLILVWGSNVDQSQKYFFMYDRTAKQRTASANLLIPFNQNIQFDMII